VASNGGSGGFDLRGNLLELLEQLIGGNGG